MKELDIFWRTMAEGLRLLAKGVDSIAEQVESLYPAEGPADKDPASGKASSETKAKERPQKRQPSKGRPKTAIATIFDIIAASSAGVTTDELMDATGFERKKIQNAIYKLKRQGKITTRSKGVYIKA